MSYHIQFRRNGRCVKQMGDYPTREAAVADGEALVAAGTVPANVQLFACEGASKKNPAKKAPRPKVTKEDRARSGRDQLRKFRESEEDYFEEMAARAGVKRRKNPKKKIVYTLASTDAREIAGLPRDAGSTLTAAKRAAEDAAYTAGRAVQVWRRVFDSNGHEEHREVYYVAGPLTATKRKTRKNPSTRSNPKARFQVYDAGAEYAGGDRYDVLDTKPPAGVGPRVFAGRSLSTGDHFESPHPYLPGKRIAMSKLPAAERARAESFVKSQKAHDARDRAVFKKPKTKAAVRKNPHSSMASIRAANKAAGGHWFDKGTNRFFGSKVEGGPYGGHYFVTSEVDPNGKKAYSVRFAADDGSVRTIGNFHSYATKADAVSAAKDMGKRMKGSHGEARENPRILGHDVTHTSAGYTVKPYGKSFKTKAGATTWLQGHVKRESKVNPTRLVEQSTSYTGRLTVRRDTSEPKKGKHALYYASSPDGVYGAFVRAVSPDAAVAHVRTRFPAATVVRSPAPRKR